MEDEAGIDEKILAVPSPRLTRYYNDINDYTDLPQILLDRIAHFFEQYKALEPNKWVKIKNWADVNTAKEYIEAAINKAKNAK